MSPNSRFGTFVVAISFLIAKIEAQELSSTYDYTIPRESYQAVAESSPAPSYGSSYGCAETEDNNDLQPLLLIGVVAIGGIGAFLGLVLNAERERIENLIESNENSLSTLSTTVTTNTNSITTAQNTATAAQTDAMTAQSAAEAAQTDATAAQADATAFCTARTTIVAEAAATTNDEAQALVNVIRQAFEDNPCP